MDQFYEPEELDLGPPIKADKNKKHTCSCGEAKMYFGKEKLCPICDESKIKEYSKKALHETNLIVCKIKKVIKGIR